MYVYLNSRLVPAAAAAVSVFDRGFAYGDSLIETLKIRRGLPVFFNEHFGRLRRSLERAGFENRTNTEGLRNQAVSLATANEIQKGRLRIQLTRGTPPAPAGIDPGEGLEPTLLLTAEPFSGYPEEIYREGIVCATVAGNRGRQARIKSGSLLGTIIARREAAAAGAQESIFTSDHGRLLEGALTNIFFFRGGRLLTAGEEEPLLAGITREKVIGIAGRMGIEVGYEAPKIAELRPGEDAAFLTGSLLGVCPVRRIDGVNFRLERELGARLTERLGELEIADIENTGP
jgi:branched-chain amino acid aminotransferase